MRYLSNGSKNSESLDTDGPTMATEAEGEELESDSEVLLALLL